MKKFIVFLLVALLVTGSAFAALTPTVSTRQRYEDTKGVTYERVTGTLAFDSTYPGNATTKVYGEPFLAYKIGLASITNMKIDAANSSVAGGQVFFRYLSEGVSNPGVTGVAPSDQPNVRAFFSNWNTGSGTGALVSCPSYDFSLLTAVPFEAVGPVL